MRRPFLWPAIGLAAGVLTGKGGWTSQPDFFPAIFLLLLLLLPFLWTYRGTRLFLPLFVLAVSGVGWVRIHQVSSLPRHHIVHFADGEWVSLEGRIASLPEVKEKGRRRIHSFVLEAKNLVRNRDFFETKGKVQIFLFNPQAAVAFGDRIRVRGRLNRPRSARNPGEFDYQNYLALQGIHAVFEGYGPRSLRVLQDESGQGRVPTDLSALPLVAIQKVRDVLARRLDSIFPGPVDALVKALLLGIRKDLPEAHRDDFAKTGTTHLIAISGMNITLVAGSFFFLALWLGLPQKGAALAGILCTVSYVFLSGAGIPVVRAGWMASLFFAGVLFEREKDLLNSLFFAFFAILLMDPRALFQVGFQLSFLSVLSLIVASSGKLWDWQGDGFQTALVILGTFPVSTAYFNVFSWASVFANLLAIPLFHLGVLSGMVSLAVAEVPLLGPCFTALTAAFLKTGLAWIHFLAERSWSYFYLRSPHGLLTLSYYVLLAMILAVRRLPSRPLGWLRPLTVSLWLGVTTLFFIPWDRPDFAFTVLSAGRNDLFHVHFPGGNHWLVNSGRGKPSDQARWILGPYLRREGANQIQGIFLTDFSGGHTGGLPTLMGNFSIGAVLSPGTVRAPREWKTKRTKSLFLFPGDRVPAGPDSEFQVLDIVDGRIFLLVRHQGYRFLILPTLRPEVLKRALPRLRGLPSVDVLVLPAGEELAAGAGKELISQWLPEWVVFSKSAKVSESLLDLFAREYIASARMDETGALRFEIRRGEFIVLPFQSKSLH